MSHFKITTLTLIVVFTSTFISALQPALATTFKVKKVKGQQAIIESSTPLEVDKVYTLETDLISEDPVYTSIVGSQRSKTNSVTVGGSMTLTKADSVQENMITLQGRYGWNKVKYEYGPLLSIDMVDEGAGFDTTYGLGGYFDYNLSPNKNTENFVFAFNGQGSFGGFNSASDNASAQILTVAFGPVLTWYIFNSSTAIRTEALYETKKISTDRQSTQTTGFNGRFYLVFYY